MCSVLLLCIPFNSPFTDHPTIQCYINYGIEEVSVNKPRIMIMMHVCACVDNAVLTLTDARGILS